MLCRKLARTHPTWRGLIKRQLGHVLALGLVGWYLMLPPVDSAGRAKVHAPLNQWAQESSYDSAAACQKGRREAVTDAQALDVADFNQIEDPEGPHATLATFRKWISDMVCVTADDPRLQ